MNIITLEEFKENFNKVLETIENKQNLINNEIQEIENFVNNDLRTTNTYDSLRNKFIEDRADKNIFRLRLPKNSKVDFQIAYKEYKTNKKVAVFRYSHEMEELFTERKLIYKQAEELAKYSDWLSTNFESKSLKSKRIPTSLNLDQKLLALQYLGVKLNKVDNTKASQIIASILGMGYDNISKRHPQVYFNSKDNEVRTKDNFEKLLKLFENEQFKEIHSQICEDMNSLK